MVDKEQLELGHIVYQIIALHEVFDLRIKFDFARNLFEQCCHTGWFVYCRFLHTLDNLLPGFITGLWTFSNELEDKTKCFKIEVFLEVFLPLLNILEEYWLQLVHFLFFVQLSEQQMQILFLWSVLIDLHKGKKPAFSLCCKFVKHLCDVWKYIWWFALCSRSWVQLFGLFGQFLLLMLNHSQKYLRSRSFIAPFKYLLCKFSKK